MRGSPFLMPAYGVGVAFWQGCAAVKSGMLHGGVCGVRVRLRGAVAVQRRGRVRCPWFWRPVACAGSGAVGAGMRGYCEAAGVVMGVAGVWPGGAAGCVTGCADLCIGTRGRNIERQGRGEQRKALRSGINARNATQRIGKGQKIPAFGREGRCWKIWIFIDLTKLSQSFLSVLTI